MYMCPNNTAPTSFTIEPVFEEGAPSEKRVFGHTNILITQKLT